MIKLLGLALFLSIVLAGAHSLMKYVSLSEAGHPIKVLADRGWALVLALAIYVGIFVFYTLMLRYFSLSALFPTYTGLSIIMVGFFSSVFFGENIGVVQLVGYITIIGGITLVSYGQGS